MERRRLFVVVALCALAALAPPGHARKDEVVHYLPFPAGTSYVVFQGNDQGPSHNDQYNRWAFDFSPMKVGSAVVASAAGVVTYVKEDTAGPTGNWRDNNMVAIRHADGTFGEYAHLKQDGVVVEVGQEVLSGDLVGYSGNTGNSRKPHLHFNLRTGSHTGDSIPCRFADVPNGGVPKARDMVTSANVAVRESGALRAVRAAIATYELAERLGCVEAALPLLAKTAKVKLPGWQKAFRDALATREALSKRRESEAKALVQRLEVLQDSHDELTALTEATFGARDYKGTEHESAIKKELARLMMYPDYKTWTWVLKKPQNYRRLLGAAIKLQIKADAKAASAKRGEPLTKGVYRSTITAYGRALKAAPEGREAPLKAHIEELKKR